MQNLIKNLNLDLPTRLKQNLEKHYKSIETTDIDKSLFIHGPAGTGKTLSAIWLLYQTALAEIEKVSPDLKEQYITIVHDNEYFYHFIEVPELLYKIKQTYKSGNPLSEDVLIGYYRNVNYLILDDIGVEKMSDWVAQIMYLIINHRYNEHKTTVFTSNYNPKELTKRFGDDRLVSRMVHMCKIIKKTKNYRIGDK